MPVRSRRGLAGAALVALVAALPFLRGLLTGQSLFFRDLALYFFPTRLFVLEGLARGELRYWNPLVHEGVPITLPPLGYPLDFLPLLRPDTLGLSLTLAAHLPLAAVALFWLARTLGCRPTAAAFGALAYALGGFALSAVNLYIYAEAVAWAPLVVLGLTRAWRGTARDVALAAVPVAVALSTVGVEVVGQAVLAGLLLGAEPGARRRGAGLLRALAGFALGVGLAAVVVLPLWAQVEGSARGAGFPTDVVLAHSVHPLTLPQTLIAAFHGDPQNLTGRWWGQNFFTRGFPYMLSLYLGGVALALALAGAVAGRGPRRRLALLAVVGLLACLGRYAGLEALVDALPALRSFRYPVKLFFTVHLAVALLAALGLEEMCAGAARAGRAAAFSALAIGLPLVLLPLLPALLPAATRYFLAGFLPPEYPWPLRLAIARFIGTDAATGGALTLCAGLLAWLAARGRLSGERSALALTAILVVDLLRAGAGLNPTVTPAFYALSPEMGKALAEARPPEGGRVFTCDPLVSPSYLAARLARGAHHEALTFATFLELQMPDFNVPFGVRTALSQDLTMLVPLERLLTPEEAGCRDFAAIAERLRRAGVSRVLSLEPLSHPDLTLRQAVAPLRIAPLVAHVYELRGARPRVEIDAGRAVVAAEAAGRLEIDVEAARPGELLVRDSFARGWSATLNGHAIEMRAVDGHRAVPVPAGTSRVRLDYSPPRLRAGLLLSTLSGLLCLGLLRGGRRAGAG
jgi:hypothetical protein